MNKIKGNWMTQSWGMEEKERRVEETGIKKKNDERGKRYWTKRKFKAGGEETGSEETQRKKENEQGKGYWIKRRCWGVGGWVKEIR